MDIEEDRLVTWYAGEVFTVDTFPQDSAYVLSVAVGKTRLFIDGAKHGNISKYINHSCDPNCTVVILFHNGVLIPAIISNKPIPAGSFLSISYGDDYDQAFLPVCLCGSQKCFYKERNKTNANAMITSPVCGYISVAL